MGDRERQASRMRIETKFLRLRTEVALGSWFGDWRVCWLGGWTKHRLNYLVMLMKVPRKEASLERATPPGTTARRR